MVDLLLSSFDRTSGELSEQAFPSLLPLRMAAEAEVLEGGGSCEVGLVIRRGARLAGRAFLFRVKSCCRGLNHVGPNISLYHSINH